MATTNHNHSYTAIITRYFLLFFIAVCSLPIHTKRRRENWRQIRATERRKAEWWQYGRRRDNLRIHTNMGGGCCLLCNCLHFSCCWKNPPLHWQGKFQFFDIYDISTLWLSVSNDLFSFSVSEEKESETSLWGLAEDQSRYRLYTHVTFSRVLICKDMDMHKYFLWGGCRVDVAGIHIAATDSVSRQDCQNLYTKRFG